MKCALVVGCGSIARRHIQNLRALGIKEILAYDPDASRVEYVRKIFQCVALKRLEDAWNYRPGLALLCTPPAVRLAAAQAVLNQKIPCFIEKPLAHTLKDAQALAKLARRNKVPVVVGYQLRRHPAILWIKKKMQARAWGKLLYLRAQVGQYLPDWRPWQDYRKSYTARRSLGGGILLDASHEIDLALYLAGGISSVFCASKKLSSLEINVEDAAELTVWHKDGALGSIHLDMIRRAYERSCQLTFEKGVVVWSYEEGQVREFSAASGKWKVHKFNRDGNAAYLSELELFLRKLNKPASSLEGLAELEDGIKSLAVVEASKRSAKSRKMEKIS